jgi:hypothetical protein
MAGREVDFSDAAVQPAFASLKDMKSPNNWLALGLVGKTNKLEVVGTGTGGLADLAAALAEDRVIFCLLRVIGADVQANVTSNREKFVYISWIGGKVGVMQRAKVGMQSKLVQQFFVGVSLAVVMDASEQKDLELDGIAKRLLACGGAHKPTKYVFGPGQEYSLVDSGLLGAAGPRAAFVSSVDRVASPAAEEAKAPEETPAAE